MFPQDRKMRTGNPAARGRRIAPAAFGRNGERNELVPGSPIRRYRERRFPVAISPCFSPAFALLLAGFGPAFSLVFRRNPLIYKETGKFSPESARSRGGDALAGMDSPVDLRLNAAIAAAMHGGSR